MDELVCEFERKFHRNAAKKGYFSVPEVFTSKLFDKRKYLVRVFKCGDEKPVVEEQVVELGVSEVSEPFSVVQ